MVSSQSLGLTEKPQRCGFVITHSVVEVADRLPRLGKLWSNLDGTLITRQCVVETVRATLRAKLYEVAANAPKLR